MRDKRELNSMMNSFTLPVHCDRSGPHQLTKGLQQNRLISNSFLIPVIASPGDDLFADFISAPLPAAATAAPANKASLSPDSEEKDFFNQVSSAPAASANNGVTNGSGNAKIDTASIMSLYAKSPPGKLSIVDVLMFLRTYIYDPCRRA